MAKKKYTVKTWKPGAAGIFSIIAGSVALGRGSETFIGMLAPQLSGYIGYSQLSSALIGLGIVAIAGGVFALRRKIWGVALAGAILAIPCIAPLGVLAIIWVYQSRKEFRRALRKA